MANIRLRVLPQVLPVDGRQIELQATDTFIQWRYVTDLTGSYEWSDLIALSEITGPEGPAIEMQAGATAIQYRVVGTVPWIDVVPLLSLTGPAGPTGATGATGAAGANGSNGTNGTNGTNGVLSAAETIKTAGYAVVAGDTGKTLIANSASAIAFTFAAAGTLGSTFMVLVKNIGAGALTFTPNGAETINGLASVVVPANASALVSSNGTALRTLLQTGGANVQSLDALTLAAGDMLYATGVGTLAKLAKGSAGQGLRQNVALTAPEFFSGWEVVPSGIATFAAVASVAFTGLSAYRALRISGLVVPATTAVDILMRFSSNNGVSYDAAANYPLLYFYNTSGAVTPAGVNSAGATAIPIFFNDVSNTDFSHFTGELFNWNKATECSAKIWSANKSNAGLRNQVMVFGRHSVATARDAIQFLASSGNISGNIIIEGLRG